MLCNEKLEHNFTFGLGIFIVDENAFGYLDLGFAVVKYSAFK